MSLQQAFRVKSLGPQMGPRRRLRMKSLGSADYDTWQRYFQPCLKKILKKTPVCLSAVADTLKAMWRLTRPTKHQRRSKVPLLLCQRSLELLAFANPHRAANITQNCNRVWCVFHDVPCGFPADEDLARDDDNPELLRDEIRLWRKIQSRGRTSEIDSWQYITHVQLLLGFTCQLIIHLYLTNLLLDESSLKSFSHLSSGSLKGSTSSPDSPDTLSLSRCCLEKKKRVDKRKEICQKSMKKFHGCGYISYLIQFSHLLQGALKLLQRPHSRQTFLRVVQTNLHFWLLRQKRR